MMTLVHLFLVLDWLSSFYAFLYSFVVVVVLRIWIANPYPVGLLLKHFGTVFARLVFEVVVPFLFS